MRIIGLPAAVILRQHCLFLGFGSLVLAAACRDSRAPAATSTARAGVSADNQDGGSVVVRFASYNASLHRDSVGQLISDLSTPEDPQARAVAEIIQQTRPDVLLINEFDYDTAGTAAQLFQDNYLSLAQDVSGTGGAQPIDYPYRYPVASNTGVPSGRDLDKNGSVGGPGDAFGFGLFPGQFAFVVYSAYPIHTEDIRTFQLFLWKDMPGAILPIDPSTGVSWYDEDDLEIFRLSSKNHADIPIRIGDSVVHLLASHPTPPVFDGPEDRNGTRNSDEIRFWADYIDPSRSAYIYDDDGVYGGLAAGEMFVIAGDQNADPFDGSSLAGAAQQLLDHPLVNTEETPNSKGAVEQSRLQGGTNTTQIGDPAFDTADFSDSAAGNLRVDYVLPRKELAIQNAGVFWPLEADPLFSLLGTPPFPSSDHRLVWVDVRIPGN